MKKTVLSFLVAGLILVLFCAGCANDVSKAKEFMKAGMYRQAISLLEKRINAKPSDAEAHFHLGVCFAHEERFRDANESFERAVKLKADYGFKIGGHYQTAGDEKLKKDDTSAALKLYGKAVEYQPNLKQAIAGKCLEKAKQYLARFNSPEADRLFSCALGYDSSLAPNAQEAQQAYGRKLLKIAKGMDKRSRGKRVKDALKYVSQRDVDAVFPEHGWKTRYREKFVGEGMGTKDNIRTAAFGKDYDYRDRIIVSGKEFLLYHGGVWKKHYRRAEFTVKSGKEDDPMILLPVKPGKGDDHIAVKAPKGQEFTVEVQRLKTSY